MFGYFACGIAALFIGLYGLSKLSLDLRADILWLMPFLLGGILTLFVIARTGQKLGADQMLSIHAFLERNLGIELPLR